MRVVDGKIIIATEGEIFGLYLDRGMDDVMSFTDYKDAFVRAGCVIKEAEPNE